ncbi:hypothetical protein ACJX0J_033188, partial [Zea mays]
MTLWIQKSNCENDNVFILIFVEFKILYRRFSGCTCLPHLCPKNKKIIIHLEFMFMIYDG